MFDLHLILEYPSLIVTNMVTKENICYIIDTDPEQVLFLDVISSLLIIVRMSLKKLIFFFF